MESAVEKFQEYVGVLSQIARRHNLKCVSDQSAGNFDQLSENEKIFTISGLQKYSALLQELETETLDFTNSRHLARAALDVLDLYVEPRLLDRITGDDFVEIYSDSMVPIFRSPNFWRTSSYSLEELYTYSYSELFERSEFSQASINRALEKVLTGSHSVIDKPIMEHEAWEKRGPYRCRISYDFTAPVYPKSGDEVLGFIIVCDIKLL